MPDIVVPPLIESLLASETASATKRILETSGNALFSIEANPDFLQYGVGTAGIFLRNNYNFPSGESSVILCARPGYSNSMAESIYDVTYFAQPLYETGPSYKVYVYPAYKTQQFETIANVVMPSEIIDLYEFQIECQGVHVPFKLEVLRKSNTPIGVSIYYDRNEEVLGDGRVELILDDAFINLGLVWTREHDISAVNTRFGQIFYESDQYVGTKLNAVFDQMAPHNGVITLKLAGGGDPFLFVAGANLSVAEAKGYTVVIDTSLPGQ